MSIKDEIKNIAIEQIQARATKGNPAYQLGTVSSKNSDGFTVNVMLNGNAVQATPLYPVVIGQQVIVVTASDGSVSAIPTSPAAPTPDFVHPPFFTGGLLRICGDPPGAGANSPYEQFLPGYPTYSGVNFYVGAFQDAFSNNIYLLQDPTRVFGVFEYISGTLSPNGAYYAVRFLDQNAENVILQVWSIGKVLTSAGAAIVPAQSVFPLNATKVTEISLPYTETTTSLGQYPILGRYLPSTLIAGPAYVDVVSPGISGLPVWTLCDNPSGDFPLAWLPNGDDPGPQYEMTPDSTYSMYGINYSAVGVTLNVILNSGEFCNASDAATSAGQSYEVTATNTSGPFQVIDMRVDNNGTVYWLQSLSFSNIVSSSTFTPIPVDFVVTDGALLVSQGVGYYLYSQPINTVKTQLGFWPTGTTNDVLNTSVGWTVPTNPFANAGYLFFPVNKTNHVWWKVASIFDISTPSLLVLVPVNPSADPGFTGNANWAVLEPFTTTISQATVTYQSENYNTGNTGQCTYNYATETISPIYQGSLSLPQTASFRTTVDASSKFITTITGNSTGTPSQLTAIQQAPGSPPPVSVAFSNPISQLEDGSISNVHNIYITSNGYILDAAAHAYKSPQTAPAALGFNQNSPLSVSPGQSDPTLFRIYAITGVAIG